MSNYIIEYEILIVDDFSVDKTISMVRKIKSKNVFLHKNRSPGVGNAIKHGILKSKKKFDPSGARLHKFYKSNLINIQKNFSPSKVKLIVDVNPVSLL